MHGCSGGHAWLLWGMCVVAPRGRAWLFQGGMCGCSGWGMCGCCWGGMHGCSRGHAWLLWGMCMVALGGCAWLLRGACMVAPGGVWLLLGGHAWLLQGGCVVAPRGCAWDTTRYGDTINERAVRILLECILVFNEKIRKKNKMHMIVLWRSTADGHVTFICILMYFSPMLCFEVSSLGTDVLQGSGSSDNHVRRHARREYELCD